ncbi:Alpha carbonic anhydrase [Melia azedarach]|uniref:Alpha carbonic anhydrase n=1 Tax=Melia azedarach TaxID=155640 RepID=A0ACC1X5U5_MELAZ|nr:Alpha carbonic anhydrase [Melia azedarach]
MILKLVCSLPMFLLQLLPAVVFAVMRIDCVASSMSDKTDSWLYCFIPWNVTDDETVFSYEEGSDTGPEKWGTLNPEWRLCGKGKYQSPIDILKQSVRLVPGLGKLKKYYKKAPAVVVNRGHDISVRWTEDAGNIEINGTYYNLIQCHWHAPAEHIFNGSRHDLELHIVHETSDGKTAVIAILYKYGRPDSFLSKLLPHIKSIGREEKELGIVNPGDINFGSRKYYRYVGSITIPPCTEGVVWTILKKVRTVSREQVRALKEKVHDGYEANARPIQDWEGKTVSLYAPRQI